MAVVRHDFFAVSDDLEEFTDGSSVAHFVGFSFRADDQPVGFLHHYRVKFLPHQRVKD